MQNLFSRLSLPQRMAIVCGGLCFLVAMALALISNFSSRYILQQQFTVESQQLAQRLARQVAPTLGQADLISLEVTLRQLANSYHLQQIIVLDVEHRQISAAGGGRQLASKFQAPITIDGNIAGEIIISRPPANALVDQRWMALGMFMLALLLSLFVAAIAASWGQQLAGRLRAAIEKLRLDDTEIPDSNPKEELQLLEESIARLPLDLLKSSGTAADTMADYQAAGLLFVRLNSLCNYVETLDEVSLLRFTELQRKLVFQAADLYDGEMSVSRQFGLLVSFGGSHGSGTPACRAACTAWLIRQVAEALQLRLQLSLSMACALSEAGTGNDTDIYPDLYCQHIVDDLAEITAPEPTDILLLGDLADDTELAARAELTTGDDGTSLLGFGEPWRDLLDRQTQILLQQLGQKQSAPE